MHRPLPLPSCVNGGNRFLWCLSCPAWGSLPVHLGAGGAQGSPGEPSIFPGSRHTGNASQILPKSSATPQPCPLPVATVTSHPKWSDLEMTMHICHLPVSEARHPRGRGGGVLMNLKAPAGPVPSEDPEGQAGPSAWRPCSLAPAPLSRPGGSRSLVTM